MCWAACILHFALHVTLYMLLADDSTTEPKTFGPGFTLEVAARKPFNVVYSDFVQQRLMSLGHGAGERYYKSFLCPVVGQLAARLLWSVV